MGTALPSSLVAGEAVEIVDLRRLDGPFLGLEGSCSSLTTSGEAESWLELKFLGACLLSGAASLAELARCGTGERERDLCEELYLWLVGTGGGESSCCIV